MARKTIALISNAPMRATYRDLSGSMNLTVDVASSINPVNRDKAKYNHIKKSVVVRDIVQVPGTCNNMCLTSPIVLELRFSAPAGVDGAYMQALLDAAVAAHGSIVMPVVKGDVREISYDA